jgi:hypothetical protein
MRCDPNAYEAQDCHFPVKIAWDIDIPVAFTLFSVNYRGKEGTRVKNTSVSVPRILVSLGVKFLLVIAAPVQAFAWGPLGHKVTAEISFRSLSPAAKVKAAELLENSNYNDSSLWPDFVKKKPMWKHTSPYHYADLPDGIDYFGNLSRLSPEEQKKGDALMAVLQAQEVLRSQSADNKTKGTALRFILHILSDLHQPLHAGRTEDRGGNDIKLNWYGKDTNLHAVWDSGMINAAHSESFAGKPNNEQVSWYASYLESKYGQSTDPCSADLLSWFNASLTLRRVSYNGYENDNASYMEASLPTLEKQLLAAGKHMACVLNLALLDPVRPPNVNNLRLELERILKAPLNTVIKLDPNLNSGNNTFLGNSISSELHHAFDDTNAHADDYEDCH